MRIDTGGTSRKVCIYELKAQQDMSCIGMRIWELQFASRRCHQLHCSRTKAASNPKQLQVKMGCFNYQFLYVPINPRDINTPQISIATAILKAPITKSPAPKPGLLLQMLQEQCHLSDRLLEPPQVKTQLREKKNENPDPKKTKRCITKRQSQIDFKVYKKYTGQI